MSKTFSLSEAQTLVPVLDALLRRAHGAAVKTTELDGTMQALNHKIYLMGGVHVDVPTVARIKAEREKAALEARGTIDEIQEIGVQIQDFDEGILELPCSVDGRVVLLCWTMGDGEILHWRETNDEETMRRALDGRFGLGHRERLQ